MSVCRARLGVWLFWFVLPIPAVRVLVALLALVDFGLALGGHGADLVLPVLADRGDRRGSVDRVVDGRSGCGAWLDVRRGRSLGGGLVS